MLKLRAEMAIDDILKKARIEQIYKEIDESLATWDEVRFIILTDELNNLK